MRFPPARITPWIFLLALLLPRLAGAAGCPEADDARRADQAEAALHAARSCLEADPRDPWTWLALSRALALGDRLEEARKWGEQAAEALPGSPAPEAWWARLLYWDHRPEEAWNRLATLEDTALEDPEILRLTADVALARGDCRVATARYRRLVAAGHATPRDQARLGDALAGLGSEEAAVDAWQTACTEGGTACDRYRLGRREVARGTLYLAPSWRQVLGGAGTAEALGEVRYRPVAPWSVAGTVDLRRRDWGDGPVSDLFGEGRVAWAPARGPRLEVAAGGTPDPVFSPRMAAWVEPGWTLPGGSEFRLRAWTLAFEGEKPTGVLSPAALWYRGAWLLYVRTFHSWEPTDDAGDRWEPGHAVLTRITWSRDPWQAWAGAATGTRSDYLEPAAGESEGFVLALAGASCRLGWRYTLRLETTWRDERTDTARHRQLQGGLGLEAVF